MSVSSLNSIEKNVFELESGNKNVDKQPDGQTDKKQTNRRNFTNFEKELSYDDDLSPYQA